MHMYVHMYRVAANFEDLSLLLSGQPGEHGDVASCVGPPEENTAWRTGC